MRVSAAVFLGLFFCLSRDRNEIRPQSLAKMRYREVLVTVKRELFGYQIERRRGRDRQRDTERERESERERRH